MGIKLPSGAAIGTLAVLVFGGITLAYLPTQISEAPGFQDTWQAKYGPEISTVGVAVVVIAVVWFVIAHVRWPWWIANLANLRLKAYLRPYASDQFVTDSRTAVSASLAIVAQSIELQPYGWDEADPFIRITYSVFNGSMYTVTFKDPSGEMYLGKSKLHEPPILSVGGGSCAAHGTAMISIDKRLKLQFWSQLKKEAVTSTVVKSLSSQTSLIAQADYPGSAAFPVGLGLGNAIPYTITER